MYMGNELDAEEINGNIIETVNELHLHNVQVSAPQNVEDWIKDKLHALCNQLTDDEMAYAIVYIDRELDKLRESDMENYEDVPIEDLRDYDE